MNIKHLTTSAVVIMLLATPTVFAASQGAKNGKPFQELSAIIDQNRSLIDANSTDIASLQSDVAVISDDIEGLQMDLNDLEGRVTTNEGEIVALRDRIGVAEGDINSLNTDLAQLRSDHDADMVDINTAIAAAVARIDALETDLQDLTVALNLRLAAIESDVDDNAVAIDGILIDLTTVTAKALANMMAINDLQGQVDALVIQAGQHEADIADLYTQVASLTSAMQSFHTTSSIWEGSFTSGQNALGLTQSWLDFAGTLTPDKTFSTVTFSGSNDPVGITCTDPAAVAQIANLLHTISAGRVNCDGHSWDNFPRTTTELWIDNPGQVGSGLNCPSPGYILRFINNGNWGGVNTATCSPPSQTMKLEFGI